MEYLRMCRKCAAINGGKKFRDSLDEEQTAVYKEYQYYATFKAFVMKYRHVRSMTNALDAAKPLVLHNPEALDSNPMLLNTPGGTYYLPEGLNGWKPTDPADLLRRSFQVIPVRICGRMPYSCSSAATRA